jgi:predicted metal-dependent peptidase
MLVNAKDLRVARVKFEDEPPPPPPPPPAPTGSGDPEEEDEIAPPPPPPVTVAPPNDPPYIDEDTPTTIIDDPRGKIDPPPPGDIERDGSIDWDEVVKDVYGRNSGRMPGSISGLFKGMLKKPMLDWKEKLKRFVSSLGTKVSYKLPNRRFLGSGKILWGTKKEKTSIDTCVVISDTSGSMTKEEIAQHLSEAADIVNNLEPEETYIIFCDAEVQLPVYSYKRGQKFTVPDPQGGGGTSFVPPFKWIQNNIINKGKKLGPVIYFTDGYGTWPTTKDYGVGDYKNDIFWVITGKDEANESIKPPFGERADLIFTETR